jgi:DNA-binding IclR family transcriptional regulator
MTNNSDDAVDRRTAPAVTRAIAVLDYLARNPSEAIPLSDIAREIGAAKSSTLNVCTALEAGRLIQRRGRGYELGRRVVELGGAYLSSFDQVREFYLACTASPLLSHELVQIAVLDGTDVLYLARHEGRAPLLLSARVGDRLPAALTAVGNALLALHTDDEVRMRYLDHGRFEPRTEHSTKDLDELLGKLAAVRKRGYAVDRGGVHQAVIGIAAGVASSDPRVSAFAVGVSLIAATPTDEEIARIGAEVVSVARTIAHHPL